jgi:hypothetical protein
MSYFDASSRRFRRIILSSPKVIEFLTLAHDMQSYARSSVISPDEALSKDTSSLLYGSALNQSETFGCCDTR